MLKLKSGVLALGLTIFLLSSCDLNSKKKISTGSLPNTTVADSPTSSSDGQFVCDKTHSDQWATIAKTSRGSIPVIIWESDYFSSSDWPPEKRCEEVSKRFQDYHEQGWLDYITIDKKNGQNVLCVTENPEGKRHDLVDGGLLVTLRPDQDPAEELRNLMQVRDGASSSPVFHAVERAQKFDSEGRLYINVEEFLSKAPVDVESRR